MKTCKMYLDELAEKKIDHLLYLGFMDYGQEEVDEISGGRYLLVFPRNLSEKIGIPTKQLLGIEIYSLVDAAKTLYDFYWGGKQMIYRCHISSGGYIETSPFDDDGNFKRSLSRVADTLESLKEGFLKSAEIYAKNHEITLGQEDLNLFKSFFDDHLSKVNLADLDLPYEDDEESPDEDFDDDELRD